MCPACLSSYPDGGFGEPHAPHAGSDALHTWRKKVLGHNENRAFQALHDFEGAVQIIEAGADEQVAHQAVQNYANAVADKMKLSYSVMKNAPHSLVNNELQNEYERLLADWVVSQGAFKVSS